MTHFTFTNAAKRRIKRRWIDATYHDKDRLAARQTLAARIRECAEDGRVAVVHGGIDCDGGRWDDVVVILPATVMDVARWDDDFFDHAEGPQWRRLRTPSDAADLQASHRDLALEAFEDGHPHAIYA